MFLQLHGFISLQINLDQLILVDYSREIFQSFQTKQLCFVPTTTMMDFLGPVGEKKVWKMKSRAIIHLLKTSLFV